MRELMRRCACPREERGVSAIFFGLAITVLIAGLGLSVDIGNVAYQRNRAQNAVDNAARDLARACAQLPTGAECAALEATASTIAAKSFDGGTVTATRPAADQVKVTISKDVDTPLLSVIGVSSKSVAAKAVASSQSGHPTEGYPVLPLGVGYCTWKNNSAFAGTLTEASHKIALRTDTLQSLRSILSPLTGTASTVLALDWLLNMLGTTGSDSCTDVDGTQLLNFQGAVWLTGETVASGLVPSLFGWDSSQCRLWVGNDLTTFLGGVEGAAFFPTGCAAKFGPGRPVAVGKTILLPIYKPQSTLQNTYGFKLLSACVGLGHKAGTPSACVEVPPKIGVEIVGYAPFKITGWTFPSTPAATDASVGCPAASLTTINLRSLVNGTMTVLDLLLGSVISLLNALLGVSLPTTSLACNGLQGYFTKSFSKDPNFQYSTGGADFGATYVKLTQ